MANALKLDREPTRRAPGLTLDRAFAPQDLDPDRLTDMLRRTGLTGDERVTAAPYAAVGTGMSSDSYRYTITYDRPTDAPATLIGKFPAADPTSRASGREWASYLNEVAFYRDVAHDLGARLPSCHVAAFDPATHDFTLLLEDLAPARVIDQVDGCGLADARTAVRAIAAVHGSSWGRNDIGALDWLRRRNAMNQTWFDRLPQVVDIFLDTFADQLESRYHPLVAQLPRVYAAAQGDTGSPHAIQHADFRLDNLLYEPCGEQGTVAVLDWGTVGFGPPLVDVSYFIGASFDADQRAAHEEELVRAYHDALSAWPVGDYDWDQCWRDYRRFCVQGLFIGVAATQTVERTERGDRIFLSMVRNACDQMERLGTFAAW
ncbi:MAG: phosphotransferase [Sphingobium sp.]